LILRVRKIISGTDKNSITNNLVTSMEKEVERLKRYHENLKIKKVASNNFLSDQEQKTNQLISQDLKDQGLNVIYAKKDRIQANIYSQSHLDDLNLEEVEALRVIFI